MNEVLARIATVTRQECRLIRRDPVPLVVVIAMPLAIMVFVKPIFRLALHDQGFAAANGSEQAVPAMSVLFGFFIVHFIGTSFFYEHRWQTWRRLRTIALHPLEMVVGKLLPWFAVGMAQQMLLFGTGVAVLGLELPGPLVFVPVVAAALAACQAALGFALVTLCRTEAQVQSYSNLSVVVLGGLGGCIAPVESLPEWVRLVSPAAPSYWALRGFRAVTLEPDVGAALSSVLVLAAFTIGFALLASLVFRPDETKYS